MDKDFDMCMYQNWTEVISHYKNIVCFDPPEVKHSQLCEDCSHNSDTEE